MQLFVHATNSLLYEDLKKQVKYQIHDAVDKDYMHLIAKVYFDWDQNSVELFI